ncbi:DUF2538 family protein [Peribacillus frigoritolerans]|uniref:DUF2538 family protein n=1 Tax=Peribacillus castrilensis TaxID=2897690 RepID=A0AAW9N868_9BACI|nr:DUF2538 family protein [Peribacillus castrilensis]
MIDVSGFINKQHKVNFKETLLRWNISDNDTEQQTACYILSAPMIFQKVERYLGSFETPIDWIWFWEYKYTLSKLPDYKDSGEPQDVPYDLTGSMVQLGKFSLNMWNGYKHFNLYDCMNS